MRINLEIPKDDCDFEFCRYFEDGKCLSESARKDCLEIALAVLCVRGEDGRDKPELQEGDKPHDS
jgi:hypothetical protein